MRYEITPVAKPRMTRSDKWNKRPVVLNYRAFADECRLRIGNMNLNNKSITFCIPMPRSWSVKKKNNMISEPHTSKPDLSNLLKALEDALYSERDTLNTHGDDMTIHSINRLRKIWGDHGAIWIE